MHGIYRLLADKEHIYSAEIEVIIEWKRCEAIVCRMLAGVKLDMVDEQLAGAHDSFEGISEFPHHDRFTLVLDDMARPSDFIAASKTEKHELVRWIYWLVLAGCIHRRRLALGCHGRVLVKYICLEGGKR